MSSKVVADVEHESWADELRLIGGDWPLEGAVALSTLDSADMDFPAPLPFNKVGGVDAFVYEWLGGSSAILSLLSREPPTDRVVALVLLERAGTFSAMDTGTGEPSLGVPAGLIRTPGGWGKEAILIDFLTSLSEDGAS